VAISGEVADILLQRWLKQIERFTSFFYANLRE
jgi:hypothetical protein